MLIHDKLFIHIPKTAGTSMEYFLGALYGYTDSYIERCIYNIEPNNLLDLGNDKQHNPIHVYNNILFSIDFIFTIIRDPYSRLISAYIFFKNYIEIKQFGKMSNLSFSEWFLKEKINNKESITTYNHHLLPQMWYIQDIKKFSYILRYERLKEEIPILLNKLNIGTPIPFPHKFKRRNNYIDYSDIKDVLPEINRYYNEDFETLNYPKIYKYDQLGLF
jgi:hypothetical protein